MRVKYILKKSFHRTFTAAKEICTTSIISWPLIDRKLNLDTCVSGVHEISGKNFSLPYARDSDVSGFLIMNKKGVKFLPTHLHRTFSELLGFGILNCSVTVIEGDSLKNMSKLKILNMVSNKIRQITDDAFTDLVNLENLFLDHNQIQFLGQNTFKSLKKLRVLYLNMNQIKVVHSNMLASLVKVQQINLDRNKIHELPENIFDNVLNLEKLALSGNKLERLPRNLFKNNLKLEIIWLGINNIKFINANMFDNLLSLKFVSLESNICIDARYENLVSLRNDLKQKCYDNVEIGTSNTTDKNAVSENYANIEMTVRSIIPQKQGKMIQLCLHF